jgi:hypothetical protein
MATQAKQTQAKQTQAKQTQNDMYRAATYDNFDKDYANKMSNYYNTYISRQMKINFNNFTNNLILI